MDFFVGPHGTVFTSNSNLSDNVIIKKYFGDPIEIPSEDLLEFVANYIMMEKIGKLEQMTYKQILNLE